MAIEFLDLDTVQKPIGRIKLKDQQYDIWPLSLKNVINLSVSEKAVKDSSVGEQIDMALGVLEEIIKDCPPENLRDLTLEQLQTLMNYVQGLGEEVVEKNSQPATPRRRGKRR